MVKRSNEGITKIILFKLKRDSKVGVNVDSIADLGKLKKSSRIPTFEYISTDGTRILTGEPVPSNYETVWTIFCQAQPQAPAKAQTGAEISFNID